MTNGSLRTRQHHVAWLGTSRIDQIGEALLMAMIEWMLVRS
jgi:hypothetical protein